MKDKNEFPLKYLRDIIKDIKSYVDLCYIGRDGVISGRPDEGGLGEYIVFPDHPERFVEFSPMEIYIPKMEGPLKELSTKTLECVKTEGSLLLSDSALETGPVVIDMPTKKFAYPKFVAYVWNNLSRYNFTNVSDEDMDKLKGGNIAELDAYFIKDEDPVQIILSGKDFKMSKSLEYIATAAVDKETTYQKSCKHNHVVTKIKYDTCTVYMLCGVV